MFLSLKGIVIGLTVVAGLGGTAAAVGIGKASTGCSTPQRHHVEPVRPVEEKKIVPEVRPAPPKDSNMVQIPRTESNP